MTLARQGNKRRKSLSHIMASRVCYVETCCVELCRVVSSKSLVVLCHVELCKLLHQVEYDNSHRVVIILNC